MATVALSGIITPTNVVTATSTTTLSNKTLVAPALGTPASGVVTNLTGTASININGTVGATTPSTVVVAPVKASTTMGVGGATPSASGSGLTFPATQSASSDANTLDDYEEGTWTPTVTRNPGTATTYTIPTGTYTKTGRTVVLLGAITPTNGTFGAAGDYIRMTGLPFSPSGRTGVGSGANNSNLNNGVSTTLAYTSSGPTIDATFESGVTNNNEYAFIVTFFV